MGRGSSHQVCSSTGYSTKHDCDSRGVRLLRGAHKWHGRGGAVSDPRSKPVSFDIEVVVSVSGSDQLFTWLVRRAERQVQSLSTIRLGGACHRSGCWMASFTLTQCQTPNSFLWLCSGTCSRNLKAVCFRWLRGAVTVVHTTSFLHWTIEAHLSRPQWPILLSLLQCSSWHVIGGWVVLCSATVSCLSVLFLLDRFIVACWEPLNFQSLHVTTQSIVCWTCRDVDTSK